jgi:hypothetical protein
MKIRIYKVGELYGLQVKDGWFDSWHCGSWMIPLAARTEEEKQAGKHPTGFKSPEEAQEWAEEHLGIKVVKELKVKRVEHGH